MNALRRYEKIMERLLVEKEVTVAELSESLQVTGKTIREDLAKLEERGLLQRVHGGAMLAQSDQHGILPQKEALLKHSGEKAEIAETAVSLIEPDDIIALDGGSTTLEIAKRLENRPLTVVTNDLFIIGELARKEEIRLVVPGGYRVRNMLAGADAAAFVRRLNIRKAFLSATGVHPEYGFTIYTGDLVEYKRALTETAAQSYGVVDSHKFGKCALMTFAQLSEIRTVITDGGLGAETAKAYLDLGVTILSRSSPTADATESE